MSLELAKTLFQQSVGLTFDEILDAQLFFLANVFAAAEAEEEGAGMALFTVFARAVNTDMKRNVERLVVERKAQHAASVQNSDTQQD